MKQVLAVAATATILAACGGEQPTKEQAAVPAPSNDSAPTVLNDTPSQTVALDGKIKVFISKLEMSQYSQGEQNCLMEYTVENGVDEQIRFSLARYQTTHTEYQSTGAMMVPRPVSSGGRDRKQLDLKGGHDCEGLQEVRIIEVQCVVGAAETEKSCAERIEVGDNVGGVKLILPQ